MLIFLDWFKGPRFQYTSMTLWLRISQLIANEENRSSNRYQERKAFSAVAGCPRAWSDDYYQFETKDSGWFSLPSQVPSSLARQGRCLVLALAESGITDTCQNLS